VKKERDLHGQNNRGPGRQKGREKRRAKKKKEKKPNTPPKPPGGGPDRWDSGALPSPVIGAVSRTFRRDEKRSSGLKVLRGQYLSALELQGRGQGRGLSILFSKQAEVGKKVLSESNHQATQKKKTDRETQKAAPNQGRQNSGRILSDKGGTEEGGMPLSKGGWFGPEHEEKTPESYKFFAKNDSAWKVTKGEKSLQRPRRPKGEWDQDDVRGKADGRKARGKNRKFSTPGKHVLRNKNKVRELKESGKGPSSTRGKGHGRATGLSLPRKKKTSCQ